MRWVWNSKGYRIYDDDGKIIHKELDKDNPLRNTLKAQKTEE